MNEYQFVISNFPYEAMFTVPFSYLQYYRFEAVLKALVSYNGNLKKINLVNIENLVLTIAVLL